jgi:hypothetical protein
VVDGSGSQDRLDKGSSTGHVNKLVIPSWEPPGTFVLKVLGVPSPKTPNRKRKAKVPQGKRGTRGRDPLKDIIKVNIITSYWDNRDIHNVGAKAGNFPKALQNGCKVLNVILNGRHKDCHIIRTKRSPQDGSTASQLV